jgi:hypothetical protein
MKEIQFSKEFACFSDEPFSDVDKNGICTKLLRTPAKPR